MIDIEAMRREVERRVGRKAVAKKALAEIVMQVQQPAPEDVPPEMLAQAQEGVQAGDYGPLRRVAAGYPVQQRPDMAFWSRGIAPQTDQPPIRQIPRIAEEGIGGPGTAPGAAPAENGFGELRSAPEAGFLRRLFVPEIRGLPPWSEATRREKAEKILKSATGIPAHLVQSLTSILSEPAWAAYKASVGPETLGEYKDLTFGQAVDKASGAEPAMLERIVGGAAGFVAPARIAQKGFTKLAGGVLPKAASKAIEGTKAFGTAEAAIQASKGLAERIDPTRTEYGYQGALPVLEQAVAGGGFGMIEGTGLGWTAKRAAESALLAGQSALQGGSVEDIFTAATIPILFATPGLAGQFFRGLNSPRAMEKWKPPADSKKMTPEEFRDWSHKQAREEVRTAAQRAVANPNDPETQANWQRVRAKYAGLAPGEAGIPQAKAAEPLPANAKPYIGEEKPVQVQTMDEMAARMRTGKEELPVVESKAVELPPGPVAKGRIDMEAMRKAVEDKSREEAKGLGPVRPAAAPAAGQGVGPSAVAPAVQAPAAGPEAPAAPVAEKVTPTVKEDLTTQPKLGPQVEPSARGEGAAAGTPPPSQQAPARPEASTYTSEGKPAPLAEAAKNRRRTLIQNELALGQKIGAKMLAEFQGEPWAELGSRPLVNPHARAVQRDKQLQKQQAWDRKWERATAAQQPPAAPKAPEAGQQPPTPGEIGPPAKPGVAEMASGEAPYTGPGKTREGLAGPPVELGGMPRQPPGLTKAEAEHLGKREQTALRAGQAMGEPIGYKLGEREAYDRARSVLAKIRMAEHFRDEQRNAAVEIVEVFVPKAKRADYIRRIVKATTARRVQKIAEAIDLYLDRAQKRQAVRDFKKTVGEIRRKYKAGEVVLGTLKNDIRDKILAVLDAYDTAKLTEGKREELQAHQDFVQRIAGSVADAFADWENLDEHGNDILQTPNARWRQLQRLAKKPIKELDVDEIDFLTKSLRHLVEVHELRNDARFSARRERLAERINTAAQEVRPRPTRPSGEAPEPGGLKKFLAIENAQLRTLVGFATGQENGATVEVLVDNLIAGFRKSQAKQKEILRGAQAQLAPLVAKIPKGKRFDDTLTVTLGGRKVRLTYNQLMSLYLDTQADGNLRRLLTARGHDLWSDKGRPIRIGKIGLAELQAAMKNLPDAYRELAEAVFAINRDYQAPAINETSIAWQGHEVARDRRHWPFPRSAVGVPSGPRVDMESAIETQGRYLPRTGGTGRHKIVPFTQQFVQGVQMDANYYGMTIPMQEARTLLANEKWRGRMQDSGHGAVLRAITTILRRKEGLSSDHSMVEGLWGRGMSGIGRGALSLRPSGLFVQAASVPLATEEIEGKYFAGLPAVTRGLVRELQERDAALWMRWHASQFDYTLGSMAAMRAFDHLVLGKTPALDEMVKHYTWGDQVQVGLVFLAARRKVEAEQGHEAGSEENWKAALDLTQRAMETQGQWDVLFRSAYSSSPNIFIKAMMMFSSPRVAAYNVLLRAMDDAAEGRIGAGKTAERVGAVVMNSVLSNLMRTLFRYAVAAGFVGLASYLGLGAFKEDKDKYKARKVLMDRAKSDAEKIAVETVLDLVGLPAFGEIAGIVAREGLRMTKKNASFWGRGPQDYRTGSAIYDMVLDAVGLAGETGKMVGEAVRQDRYADIKSNDDKAGELKWTYSARKMAEDVGAVVSRVFGLPMAGPMSDIVWPIRAVERDAAKILTPEQLLTRIATNTFAEGRIRPHKGREKTVQAAMEEYKRQKGHGPSPADLNRARTRAGRRK